MPIGRFNLKRLAVICVLSIFAFILLGVLFYKAGSRIVFTQTKNEAMRIAKAAAADIDGDVFAAVDSEGSPAFEEIYGRLAKYRDTEKLDFIYSMKKIEGDQLVFVVDTDEADPAGIFEPYEWLEDMAPAFAGTVCADEEFTSDEWGTFLSGYAPIYDSQNVVVGIVGCDINIVTINERLLRLRLLIIILGIITNTVMVIMLEPLDRN